MVAVDSLSPRSLAIHFDPSSLSCLVFVLSCCNSLNPGLSVCVPCMGFCGQGPVEPPHCRGGLWLGPQGGCSWGQALSSHPPPPPAYFDHSTLSLTAPSLTGAAAGRVFVNSETMSNQTWRPTSISLESWTSHEMSLRRQFSFISCSQA